MQHTECLSCGPGIHRSSFLWLWGIAHLEAVAWILQEGPRKQSMLGFLLGYPPPTLLSFMSVVIKYLRKSNFKGEGVCSDYNSKLQSIIAGKSRQEPEGASHTAATVKSRKEWTNWHMDASLRPAPSHSILTWSMTQTWKGDTYNGSINVNKTIYSADMPTCWPNLDSSSLRFSSCVAGSRLLTVETDYHRDNTWRIKELRGSTALLSHLLTFPGESFSLLSVLGLRDQRC